MGDREQELRQLDAYHAQLAATDPEAQASLLLNGFLPEAEDVLIEAGVRCLPLIEGGRPDVADGAVHRLETILFKLRLAPESASGRRVLGQFERIVSEHRKADQSNLRHGLVLILGLGIVAAAVIAFIAWSLLK